MSGRRWKSVKVTEAQVLQAVLRFMKIHPAIDWVARINSGATHYGRTGRFVRFGFVGAADIWGQLKADGRLIVVECKSPKGKLTPAQAGFLARVGRAGVAIVARDVRDVATVLDGLLRRTTD